MGPTRCERGESPKSSPSSAFASSNNPASRSLVVWDPGGPGLGLPDADANLAVLVPRAIRDHNVLLVVEPWARDRPPDSCLRSAFENEPDHTCHLSRLTTSSRGIEATLALAESQTGLTGVGAYLQSFGATRSLSALTQPSGPDVSWVVLESPGPPPGSDALDLMTARKQVMLRLLVHRCGAVECGNRVRHSMDRLARDGVGVQTTGREFALGLIALATLPQDNDRLLTAVSEQLSSGKISSHTASQLRLLGRLYEGKRPGQAVSPSVIGLWADTCPRLTGWDRLARSSDPILQAYSWTFRGCLSDGMKPSPQFEMATGAAPPVLMLTGSQDAVVPPKVQAAWLTRGLRIDLIRGVGHFWDSSEVTRHVRSWIEEREAE